MIKMRICNGIRWVTTLALAMMGELMQLIGFASYSIVIVIIIVIIIIMIIITIIIIIMIIMTIMISSCTDTNVGIMGGGSKNFSTCSLSAMHATLQPIVRWRYISIRSEIY